MCLTQMLAGIHPPTVASEPLAIPSAALSVEPLRAGVHDGPEYAKWHVVVGVGASDAPQLS